ncbi:MAG: GspH/FimT family pseudopilin [Burkholderiales bacterium]
MSLPHPSPPFAATRLSRLGHAGFTAIELLVVISIAAILVALALPSFNGVIARYQIQRATEEMISTIYQARSEAIKRGGQVMMVKTATGVGCSAPTAQEWSCGWTLFFDANSNGTFDTGAGSSDIMLRSSGAPKAVNVGTTLAAGFTTRTFDRWGRSNGLGIFGFHFDSLALPSTVPNKMICMSSGGRLRTLTDAGNTCPNP